DLTVTGVQTCALPILGDGLVGGHGGGIGGIGAITAADHVHRDGELIAAELRLLRILVGVSVDQLNDPVAVRAAGRSDEVDQWSSGKAKRTVERTGGVRKDVRSRLGETLIVDQPAPPGRIGRIGRKVRASAVGYR